MNTEPLPLIQESLHILLVEDAPFDAELIVLQLQEQQVDFTWRRVQTEAEFSAALRDNPDLILSDWSLPAFSALRVMDIINERKLAIPVVIVSGTIGEETAIKALQHGAFDYILKDRLARIGPAIQQALEKNRLLAERKQTLDKLHLVEQVFECMGEGITITDVNANIVAVNPAFTAISGYEQMEVLGRNPKLLKSGRHDLNFFKIMWASLLETGHWRGEIWNSRKNGQIYPAWLAVSAVKEKDESTTHYVGVFNDISEIKQAQHKLDFLAHHDALTGLFNRVLLRDRLNHALERAKREGGRLALLFIDLDRFKFINDTLGHPVGDEILKLTAQRISLSVRAEDTVARLGGDEFVLLLEDEVNKRRAAEVARKLIQLLVSPMTIDGHTLTVTASIGIALYPSDGEDVDSLLKHADLAMYRAKEKGRNTFHFFAAELSTGALDRLVMENALRGAVERKELLIHYQPQINFGNGELAGVEALLRWQHPEFGLVLPCRFISLAEEMGIIYEIGHWVLNEACRQTAEWLAQGYNIPRVSVNLSMQQVERADLVKLVTEVLTNTGLAARRLELEVTESMIMNHPEKSIKVLDALRKLGVSLAVDDFGTGYSCLAYLKQLSLDRLKIDKSFVRDIGNDPNSEAIIRVIIALAKTLALTTIAEGVETAEQAAFLKDGGSDIAQGFWFAYPQTVADLEATWLNLLIPASPIIDAD
ncbi:MAG: EAL domain-containing protein [Methylococcales bacterium]